MKATAKELRFNTKEILDTVSRGEEVVITYRGKPRAKIVPFHKYEKTRTESGSLFGIWRDHDATRNVEEYVRGIRKGRKP